MDKNLNPIKERILYIADCQGVGRENFFQSISLKNDNFKGKALESSPSTDIVVKILHALPNINPNWLLLGIGEMSKNKENFIPLNKKAIPLDKFLSKEVNVPQIVEEPTIQYKSGNTFKDLGNGNIQMLVPLVEQYAYAGYLSGLTNAEYIDELPKIPISVERHHKGTYRAFKVRGDSMDNGMKYSISNGETIVGRMINKEHWKSRLHLFQWQNYIIVHEDGIIVKRVTHHDVENGIISCESVNPDKKQYPDFQINLSEVYELYNVVQIIINNY